jgi:hypothetical protein
MIMDAAMARHDKKDEWRVMFDAVLNTNELDKMSLSILVS